MAIKNIIFDLGAVLLDIDFNKTKAAFINAGINNFDAFYTKEKANPLFESLETGDISDESFYTEIQKHCRPGTSFAQIQHAWNEILVGFRKNSIAYLHQLKERYNIFLLSNTNQIHYNRFTQMFEEEIGGKPFDEYFTIAWYSHQIHKRKPYIQTYQYVLEMGGLQANETLFIDDALPNIQGAQNAGLHTKLLAPNERIENLQW